LDATPHLPAERARIADGDLTHVRPAADVAIPREAAAARGLLTAFREGLERARFTGAPDATPPPDDALQLIIDRGRIAERAGDLDLGEAGLTWSTAVSSMLASEGDKAAYFTGEALAQASAK